MNQPENNFQPWVVGNLISIHFHLSDKGTKYTINSQRVAIGWLLEIQKKEVFVQVYHIFERHTNEDLKIFLYFCVHIKITF